MFTSFFIVGGLVFSAYILVMHDWNNVDGRQEDFRKMMINRRLMKISEEIAEKYA